MTKRRTLEDGPGPTVVVRELPGDPIDIERWVKQYVAVALEVEGVKPRVATPPVRSVG